MVWYSIFCVAYSELNHFESSSGSFKFLSRGKSGCQMRKKASQHSFNRPPTAKRQALRQSVIITAHDHSPHIGNRHGPQVTAHKSRPTALAACSPPPDFSAPQSRTAGGPSSKYAARHPTGM